MKNDQRLYLMKSDDGLFKVGISDNPERRRRQIQNASGRRVKILECWATEVPARTVEKAVHRMYSRRRKQGEWFTHMSYMDVQCAGYGLTQCNHDGTLRYRDILDELEQKTNEMCNLFWPELQVDN